MGAASARYDVSQRLEAMLDAIEIEWEQLQRDMMYLWLERDHSGNFFHVPLASISEYKNWTRGQFLDAVEELANKFRKD